MFFFSFYRFLEATDQLYAAEGQRLMQYQDMPEYLRHVDKRLAEENERLLHYLDTSTRVQLVHTVEKQLISEHLINILQKGLDTILNENRISDVSLLYTLFSRVKTGLHQLCIHFNSFIKVSIPLQCRIKI